MADDDKYEVRPMDEEQAQAWLKLGGDALDKLEPRDVSNLQLAMEANPNAFSDAQRAQVKDVAWKMVENVASGKRVLDPKETDNFKSILGHVPSTTFIEGKDLETFKKAEQKWYNADRGIEEKSFGQRIGEKASTVKQHISEKVTQMEAKGKAVSRLNRMRRNRTKENIKNKFKAGKEALKNFGKTAVRAGQDVGLEFAADAVEIYQGIRGGVKYVGKKIKQGTDKVKAGANKVKNGAKKFWNGTKKVAKGAWKVATFPVVGPYKAAKWTYNKGKAGVNWVKKNYNNFKKALNAGPTEISKDVKTAEKQAKGNQNKLSAEQIMANWSQIGRGESDGRYNMSRHSESVLDAVMKGEMKIDKANAPQIAAWLEVNRDIQDRINKNNVVAKNERNQAVAAQLEQFGIKNPYKTDAVKENEANSPTPPAPEKPKTQDNVKQVQPLSKEQQEFVDKQLDALKSLAGENKDGALYQEMVGMMNKGFLEKGLTADQVMAVRQQNKLLPEDQNPKTKYLFPEQKDTRSPGQVEMDKASDMVKDTFQHRPSDIPTKKVPPLTEKQQAFVKANADALKKLTENNKDPAAHQQYLGIMNESFKGNGLSADQIMAANQTYGMLPEGQNPGIKYEFDKPKPTNQAQQDAPSQQPQPQQQAAPDPKNPETFNLDAMSRGTADGAVNGTETKPKNKAKLSPEQVALRKQKQAARKIQQSRGLVGDKTPKPVQKRELDPNVSARIAGTRGKSAAG